MVHRDPETGQFLSHDDEPLELTYSDHEYANFRLAVLNTGGDDVEIGTEYQLESDVLDLENDELAMLTWLNCSMAVYCSNFVEDNATRGGASVTAEVGANLADSEFLNLASVNDGIQIVDNEADATPYGLRATDEAGLWAHLNCAIQQPFQDTDAADQAYSGGGTTMNDRIRRVYSEETGSGPYIDSTDDINISLFVDKSNADGQVRSIIYGQMAFLIHEYENRRAEFAPYDPGASM